VTEPVTLDRGRIRLGGLFVYLEHVVRPAARLGPEEVPRAYGVAPTALSADGTVLAAVADDEAVWLGFQPTNPAHAASVRVRVDADEVLDAVTGRAWNPELVITPRNHLVVPPDSRLVGIPRGGGIELFTAPMRLTVLVVDPPGAAVGIDLIEPAAFERLTGRRPPPLDRSRGYTGWRAP
jgi:hypothetical protein